MIANHQQREMTLGGFVMFVYNTFEESRARAFVCFAVQSRWLLFSDDVGRNLGATLRTS